MTDPRRGKPSASGADRLHNCSASHKMEQEHGRDMAGEDAASGTRIHAVLAGDAKYSTLTLDEQHTAGMCSEQCAALADAWLHEGPSFDAQTIRETRLGLTRLGVVLDVTPDSRAEFIFTGQADVVCLDNGRAFILDYKTGRGETPVAADNPQLMALAVLVWLRYKVKTVRVCIIQPWAGKPTLADFTENSLHLAKSWLLERLEAAENASKDDLRPGDHCKYCKAAWMCPALNHESLQKLEVLDPASIAGKPPKEQREVMWARSMQLAPQQHAARFRGLAMIRRMCDVLEESFAARVEAGEIEGWKIETTPGNREITDPQKALNALIPLGVTVEDVMEACSLSIGPLEKAVRVRSGIKSQTDKRTLYNLTGDEAKKALNNALNAAECITRKADKKSVVAASLELAGEERE